MNKGKKKNQKTLQRVTDSWRPRSLNHLIECFYFTDMKTKGITNLSVPICYHILLEWLTCLRQHILHVAPL